VRKRKNQAVIKKQVASTKGELGKTKPSASAIITRAKFFDETMFHSNPSIIK